MFRNKDEREEISKLREEIDELKRSMKELASNRTTTLDISEEPVALEEPLGIEEPEIMEEVEHLEPVELSEEPEEPEPPEEPEEARAWRRSRRKRDWDAWGDSLGDYIGGFVEDVMEGVAAEIETSFRFHPRERVETPRRYRKPRSVDVSRAASVMSALGNENRIKILDALSHGGLYAGDLQEALGDIGASTLSSHLDVLEESGLITQERRRGRYLITVPGRLAVNMAYEISKRSEKE
jgi:DNA-binding transcriptional ArsR family regulator